MLKSFATTVATPWKCPGRHAPQSCSASFGGETTISCGTGYISFSSGANTTWQPRSPSSLQSRSSVRG